MTANMINDHCGVRRCKVARPCPYQGAQEGHHHQQGTRRKEKVQSMGQMFLTENQHHTTSTRFGGFYLKPIKTKTKTSTYSKNWDKKLLFSLVFHNLLVMRVCKMQ